MDIKDDSRKINKGDTFIALKKVNDGHDYIKQAIENGATKIIAEYGEYDVETVLVKDTHEYLLNYLQDNCYSEIEDLNLIGMTGTNGKTTTCYLLYQALLKNNIKAAYIGTIGFYIDEKIKDLNNTTPDILELYEMLIECKNQGVTYVVMEVSSHSLSMKRVQGLKFKYGIFSNITQDHLDYHKTFDNYINAKQQLFEQVTDKTFVNIDDSYKEYFLKFNSVTYGFNTSDYQIKTYNTNLNNTIFKVNKDEYKVNLVGKHNIYNMTVVIAVLQELKLNTNIIEELVPPKGRMEIVTINSNVAIIDYAHTPDAVYNVINTIKEVSHNKIITIIGCGGNRDKTKRPIMGKLSTKYSDYVIFTSDNPRDENPEIILDEITKTLTTTNYEIVLKREDAIKKGIQMLVNNDILLVLGKGHENYQLINGIKHHFDDVEEVLKYRR